MEHPVIVLTGPSGAGKTSIAHRLLEADPQLVFSISATTRRPRDYEVDGKDYFFFSEEDFRGLIQGGKLLEYEEVYPGTFYGTLRSELDRLTQGQRMLLDIDIKGALQLRDRGLKKFPVPVSSARRTRLYWKHGCAGAAQNRKLRCRPAWRGLRRSSATATGSMPSCTTRISTPPFRAPWKY